MTMRPALSRLNSKYCCCPPDRENYPIILPRALTAICEWCDGGHSTKMRSTSFLSNTSSILLVENGMSNACATFSASSVVLPHIASILKPCKCNIYFKYFCKGQKAINLVSGIVHYLSTCIIRDLPLFSNKELWPMQMDQYQILRFRAGSYFISFCWRTNNCQVFILLAPLAPSRIIIFLK